MRTEFQQIPGSVVAPKGFLASGVFCDIKRLGTGKGSNRGLKRDLALIVSEVPATVAGLFTTNQISAAPVHLCRAVTTRGRAQAIVANSGNANACTGRRGMADARAMAAEVAAFLHLPPAQILVASTGRIGVPLPMANVRLGIRQASALLGNAPEHAAEAAEAIMTSDTHPKVAAVEFNLDGKPVRIGGICKGAGMIHPGLSLTGRRPPAAPHATMLAFLTTDAAAAAPFLRRALSEAVARSFNRITIDGDMSTNDTVLLLANGLADNRPLGGAGPRAARAQSRFQDALNQVCLELARMIVRDGEGVSKCVTVRVTGARTAGDADAAARAVANSALVKTSWCGGDPNWGRIIDALGYSPARIVETQVDIGYAAPGQRSVAWCLRHGQPTRIPFAPLCAIVAHREFDLHIRLNLGRASAVLYAADLTEAYVDFNKGDVGNPAARGG